MTHGPRSALRAPAVATLLMTAWLGMAVPAAAHTALIATDPAADASLPAGPARVSATFNEELQSEFAAMTVIGPDRNIWSAGNAQVRGAVVGVGLRPLGPSGVYTVNYRVTSADGHVVSGSWSFTVTMPSAGTPGPAATTQSPPGRIPLWPLALGAGLLAIAAVGWTLRRRS